MKGFKRKNKSSVRKMSKLVDRYQMTESECELSSRRALSFNSSQLSTLMSSAAGTMLAILSSGTGPCWQGPCCQQELMQVINKKWVNSGSERVQWTRHISKQWRHSRRESWPFKNGESIICDGDRGDATIACRYDHRAPAGECHCGESPSVTT